MNTKQQQLLFDKGITNVPSDILCSDNALEESMGLVYDDGEHRVIQKPKEARTVTGTLLFVHKIPGGDEHDIVSVGNEIKYNGTKICDGGTSSKISAVGKTLIINNGSQLCYAVWKSDSYRLLSGGIPEVEVKFSMSEAECKIEDLRKPEAEQILTDLTYTTPTAGVYSDVVISDEEQQADGKYYHILHILSQEAFNNAAIGIVSSHLNDIKKSKRFCFPFWVRYAVRLYDGTHTNISNPILMMPSVHRNCNAYFCQSRDIYTPGSVGEGDYRDPQAHYDPWPMTYDPYSAELKYQILTTITEEWSDIVKGVDVFVSEEVKSFSIDDNWRIVQPYSADRGDILLYDSRTGHQDCSTRTGGTRHTPADGIH